MKAISTFLLAAPLTLALACGGESTTHEAGGSKAAGAKGAAPSTAADEEVATAPTLKREDGVRKLDTGYDLSKLAAGGGSQAPANQVPGNANATGGNSVPANGVVTHDAPEDGHDHANPDPAVNPAALDGPPGHISMVEGEPDFDFGKVHQGDKATHVFKLVSDGDNPLKISRIKPSCGCTVAEVQIRGEGDERTAYTLGDPIEPGTQFEIQTELKSDGRQGNMHSQVAIYSNDPRSVFNLKLSADVEPLLIVEPATTLNFNRITAADRVEGSLRVRSELLEPFLLSVDERFLVEPLSVELVPVEPNAEGKAKAWDVNVTLGPKIPEGIRNYPLELATDVEIPAPKNPSRDKPPVYETRVYVQAQVTGMVSATPNFLSFGMQRPGEPSERTVRIEVHDDFQLASDMKVYFEGLQGQPFGYASSFDYELTEVEPGKVLDVTVKCLGMPETLNGSYGGVLKVDANHPMNETLAIRFSGVCRAGLPQTQLDRSAAEKERAERQRQLDEQMKKQQQGGQR